MSWLRPDFTCGDLHRTWWATWGLAASAVAIAVGPDLAGFDLNESTVPYFGEVPNEYIVASGLAGASLFAFIWFLYGRSKIGKTSACQWTLEGQ